jgi:hypothetical protein
MPMRLMNDCIERATHFQALAEAETDPKLRASCAFERFGQNRSPRKPGHSSWSFKFGRKAGAVSAGSELFGERSAKSRKTRANSKPRKGGRNTMRTPGWTSACVG